MSKLSIEIKRLDHQPDVTPEYIIVKMNERFKTLEQFEQQIDVVCMDIAYDISAILEQTCVCNVNRCQFYRHTGVLLFDCTELK